MNSNEEPDPVLCIRWPNYWSFNFSINPSNEYSGLISFRIDCFDLLAAQGTLKKSSPTPQFKRISSSAFTLTHHHHHFKSAVYAKVLPVVCSAGLGKCVMTCIHHIVSYRLASPEKAMAAHSSVLAWRIPGTGEPGGLPSMGSHRVGHGLSDSAAAADWLHRVKNPLCSAQRLDLKGREEGERKKLAQRRGATKLPAKFVPKFTCSSWPISPAQLRAGSSSSFCLSVQQWVSC